MLLFFILFYIFRQLTGIFFAHAVSRRNFKKQICININTYNLSSQEQAIATA